MQINRGCPFLYRITIAFFAAIFVFCSFGVGQITAWADSATIFTVETTADGVAGSMRKAIIDANAVAGDFKIVIEVDGTLATATALPVLIVLGRSGWIQGRPDATITGFSCDFADGGVLTLQNATIDNSAYDLAAITVPYGTSATLILAGSNRVIGSVPGYDPNVNLSGTLTIDKAPGGTDMDSTLILTDTDTAIFGQGQLRVMGGTLEAHGVITGMFILTGVLVNGGKLIVTGGHTGVSTDNRMPAEFRVNGGTVVASGSAMDISSFNAFVITGGSVNARKISGGRPKDGSGTPHIPCNRHGGRSSDQKTRRSPAR